MAKQRVGYFEDREDPEAQCSRCRLCELICAFHHHQVGNPRRGKIKVIALGKGVDIPVVCLNCGDAPCMDVCPTGALHRKERDGMVLVRSDVCIGCATCVNVCPAGAITLDPVEGTAAKCDLCGGKPRCVAYCPAKVLRLTDAEGVSRKRMRTFARSPVPAEEGRNLKAEGVSRKRMRTFARSLVPAEEGRNLNLEEG